MCSRSCASFRVCRSSCSPCAAGNRQARAFEIGADDYITKPFGMGEFIARMRGALRRRLHEEAPQPVFTVGGLQVDLARRIVRLDDAELRLSPKQYRLLQVLVTNAGKVVTHQQLLREVWGNAHTEDVHYLRIFVRKLRSSIESDPTRPRFCSPSSASAIGCGRAISTTRHSAPSVPAFTQNLRRSRHRAWNGNAAPPDNLSRITKAGGRLFCLRWPVPQRRGGGRAASDNI